MNWAVYIDNDSIRAEETEMCECVVTNKTSHDIWLITNVDRPISESAFIHANESVSITDADLVRRIKEKEVQVFYWK